MTTAERYVYFVGPWPPVPTEAESFMHAYWTETVEGTVHAIRKWGVRWNVDSAERYQERSVEFATATTAPAGWHWAVEITDGRPDLVMLRGGSDDE